MGGDGGPAGTMYGEREEAPLMLPGAQEEPALVAVVARPHRDVSWARFFTAFNALTFILGFVAVGKRNKSYDSLTSQSALAVRGCLQVPTPSHTSDAHPRTPTPRITAPATLQQAVVGTCWA